MKCQFCDQELPDGAKYCSKYSKQIICKECGKKLIADSTLCVFCGIELAGRSQVKGMNHIKYTESEHGKSFEATFSDETAGNVVETYVRFLPPVSKDTRVMNMNMTNNDTFTEVEEVSNALPFKSEQRKQSDNGSPQIDQVFKIRGENEIYLHETSLKASSKVDYAGRLTLLYLLYQQLYNYGKSKPKINLLFVYYLANILAIDNITQDHIFTCYRQIGISIPNNLYQCLADTIHKKGWIENISNLSVTVQGINEVERNLKK